MSSSEKLLHRLAVPLTSTGIHRRIKTSVCGYYCGEFVQIWMIVGDPRMRGSTVVRNFSPVEPNWHRGLDEI